MEVNKQQVIGEPLVEYGYNFGSLWWKRIGNELIEDYTIDESTGLIKESTDPSGNVTTYWYDALNRLTDDNPPGEYRHYLKINYDTFPGGMQIDYTKNRRVIRRIRLDSRGNPAYEQQLRYNGDSAVLETIKNSTYSWRNQVVKGYHPGTGTEIFYSYDCLGRLREIQDNKSAYESQLPVETSITYTVVSPSEYMCHGTLKSVQVDNTQKQFLYDTRGNLVKVTSGGPAGDATYIYDAKGNLLEVHHGGTNRFYTYDLLNRKITSTEPETGGDINGDVIFDYHDDGKIRSKETPNGTIWYFYDNQNRLSRVECPQGRIIRELFYNQSMVIFPDDLMFEPLNASGKLTSLVEYDYQQGKPAITSKLARSYNIFGEIESEASFSQIENENFTIEPRTYTTNYAYDEWSNLHCIQYPVSGAVVVYGNKIGDTSSPFTTNIQYFDPDNPEERTIVPNVVYNETGKLKFLRYENNVWMGILYDNANRPNHHFGWNQETNTIYSSEFCEFDGLDRIRRKNSKIYEYNLDGSLKTVRKKDDNSVVYDYSYDSSGNMTDRVATDIPELGFSNYNYINNQFSSPYCDYDGNGNLIYNGISVNSYNFTPENRMTQAVDPENGTVDFIYDSEGNRRLKINSGTAEIFFYDLSGNYLLEKLTYDVSEPHPVQLKDDCFVNFRDNTIAEFDYIEPVVSIDFVDHPGSVFLPGETLTAQLNIDYKGPTQEDIWPFIILEVANSFFFYPSWDGSLDGLEPITLPPGSTSIDIIEVPFGPTLPTLYGLHFYAMLSSSYTDRMQFGNIAIREFSLHSSRGDYYAKPGEINGTGSIFDPFNSLHAAVNAIPSGQHTVLRLFPGEYEISNPDALVIEGMDLEIIGSGINETVITGNSTLSRIEVNNDSSVVFQDLKTEINLNCTGMEEGATPAVILRNIQFENNGALYAVCGVYSDVTMINCLISGYEAAVGLNNSPCYIQNCTIDSCGTSVSTGGVLSSTAPENEVALVIENSIITRNTNGVSVSGPVNLYLRYTDIFDNDENIVANEGQIQENTGCISLDPEFIEGEDHLYYLKAISAGQSVDSPCLDTCPTTHLLEKIVGGTTRTDGLFDQCQQDMGYHGQRFNEIVDIRNLNNDLYNINDPAGMFNGDTSNMDSQSVTIPDPSALLGIGPKDLLVIKNNPDETITYQSFFQIDCELEPQSNPESPSYVIDAALSDVDKDGSWDIVLAEENSISFYLNDSEGNMAFDSSMAKPNCRAVDTLDLNEDTMIDIVIATADGVSVQVAEDYLSYQEFQLIPSGDTIDMVLYDFDQDHDLDLVTLDATGILRTYENQNADGFGEVGEAIETLGAGNLRVVDMDNDGQMDIVVEIASGIEQTIQMGDAYGYQQGLNIRRRAIRYAIFDHLGTTKNLTNRLGFVTWPGLENTPNETLPFGKDLDFDPEFPDPVEAGYLLTFTNKEIDHQLDLHYFGARYYHATSARFISPDPVGGTPANPLSWNRYLYCRNDPINYFDPDGEQPTDTDANKNRFSATLRRAKEEIVNYVESATKTVLQFTGIGDGYELATGKTLKQEPTSNISRGLALLGLVTGGLGDDGVDILRSVSKRNLKHIAKHLDEFKNLDNTMDLEKVVDLGQKISKNADNLVGTPGDRKIFQSIENIGNQNVTVRVVLNKNDTLRSVYVVKE